MSVICSFTDFVLAPQTKHSDSTIANFPLGIVHMLHWHSYGREGSKFLLAAFRIRIELRLSNQ